MSYTIQDVKKEASLLDYEKNMGWDDCVGEGLQNSYENCCNKAFSQCKQEVNRINDKHSIDTLNAKTTELEQSLKGIVV